MKQRLGKSNIQARLGRPVGTLARGALGGRGLALGQRGLPRGALRGRGARAMLRGGVALRGQSPAIPTPPQSPSAGQNPTFLPSPPKVKACCAEGEGLPRGWACGEAGSGAAAAREEVAWAGAPWAGEGSAAEVSALGKTGTQLGLRNSQEAPHFSE